MGSTYYASLCFGMSQHSLWKDKEMSVAPMRQLTRHWFRVSIYFTDIASWNMYNDIIFSNQMHWSKGSYLAKYYRVRWWLTGWSACYLSTRTWVWIPALTQNPRHNSIDLVIPALAFRDRKILGACSPANLANRWAPHSARDPVSRKKVDNDRRHPTLTLASICTCMGIYTHMHIHTEKGKVLQVRGLESQTLGSKGRTTLQAQNQPDLQNSYQNIRGHTEKLHLKEKEENIHV